MPAVYKRALAEGEAEEAAAAAAAAVCMFELVVRKFELVVCTSVFVDDYMLGPLATRQQAQMAVFPNGTCQVWSWEYCLPAMEL